MAEWQTRTFKGRVGDHTGSSPVCRTKRVIFLEHLKREVEMPLFFNVTYILLIIKTMVYKGGISYG